MPFKLKMFSVLSLFIFTGGIKACNIDSLFVHHTTSIEIYIERIINGEILPTGDNTIIYASIDGKPIKTNYTDSTKFTISGENAEFLKMYEMINKDVKFE